MPQMSPMYWMLLLIYTIMLMYIYLSMLYFNLMTYCHTSKSKKYPKLKKKMKF